MTIYGQIQGPGPKIKNLLENIDIRTQAERERDNLLKLALILATALVVGQCCAEKIIDSELYQIFMKRDNYTQTYTQTIPLNY